MIRNFSAIAAALVLCAPHVAYAQDKYVVHPVRLGDEAIRFYKGTPTIDIDGKNGAVQISTLPMDHGSFSFSVAVLNKSATGSDFDVGNVTAEVEGKEYAAFTKDELERKAKNRAMWAAIAIGVAGGFAAAAAASQRDEYRATMITPRGTYRAYYSAPSAVGQVQAAAISAGTVYSLARVQDNLDQTRAALGDAIVQRTTIDPDESYAGQVILQKIKLKTLPQKLTIRVRWNGEDYRFGFLVGKRGMKAPEIAPLAPRVTPTSPQPVPDEPQPSQP
ncbi:MULTISPECIES: hypothetical protein [unclassified Sphingomonas]|uniref:hypothetical protein n=1 Tax=unclassified Sphingomonas TaxID=196159 RepID=UPI000829E4C9|nr:MULTISPECIES: hypothetical protein [unclassified Sphingomonas]